MMCCNEPGGFLQRSVQVTLKPTVTEVADAIWNMDDMEQIMLLGCLKRRFCNNEGLLQIANVVKGLDEVPAEKAEEAKLFVRHLADYVLGGDKENDAAKITDEVTEDESQDCTSSSDSGRAANKVE